MTPLPTPYDITPVPAIPYTPGFRDWILLGAFLAGCGAFVFSFTRQRIRQSISPLESARSELTRLEESLPTAFLMRNDCFSASQTTKRAIDAAFRTNLHAASLDELQRLGESHTSDTLRKIVHILAGWDVAKFGRCDETAIPREQLRSVRMLLVSLMHHGIAPAKDGNAGGTSNDP